MTVPLDRLTEAELDHLRAVGLPASLIDPLQTASGGLPASALNESARRISRLLSRMRSHLPAYLVEWVAANPAPGQAGGQFLEGALLFADISGFTAMSESLSRIGKEGAEEITTIINGYFNQMLAILRDGGGQLIKFGGDALLGLFLEPDSAARAVQAALEMQAAMAGFAQTRTSQGTFPLHMKVALHRGRFFAAQLGTPKGMTYALFGAHVNATAASESAATAGQVLLDRATLDAVGAPCEARPVGEDGRYFVVERLRYAAPFSPAPMPAQTSSSLSGANALASLRQTLPLVDALALYLPETLVTRLAATTRAVELEGEHRLVALLFANVHGLGDIADGLGPGREAEIVQALNAYFVAMDDAVRRFEGVVNKMDLYDHGDKLLAFFGAPVAHEDDVERAVRAALEMQTALKDEGRRIASQDENEVRSSPFGPRDPARRGETAFNDQPAKQSLHQQVGLNYGYVFAGYVGADWQREYTVMGDEVNLSARLMSVAEPGSVTVGPNVRRKVQALFDLGPRGTVKLKGKSAPVPIFAVTGPRTVPEQVTGLAGMRSSLVGREAEWGQLMAAMERVLAGQGQIVSITGEAGLGKSRLSAEMRQHLGGRAAAVRWVEGRCLSYTESVSYFPMLELVKQLLGVRPDDSETEAWNKLRQVLSAMLTPDDARAYLPYLANFINLALDEAMQSKIRYLDAEALQRQTFIAIRSLIEAQIQASGQPLVLMVDDLHWVDQASVTLLEYLMPLVEQAPLMLLLLYRPEQESGVWRVREKALREFGARFTDLPLRRLDPDDCRQLLTHLVRLDPWPTEMQELILSRTEGNPLYIEELLRVLVDDGVLVRDEPGWRVSGDVEALKVPDTLEGVMMTRLDRLGEAFRHTTQVAAVVGRLFPFDTLEHVLPPENQSGLNACLSRLQQQEIAREDQRAPELVYKFRHGMMQEVCYGSLLARTRRQYHRAVAEYLAAHHGEAEEKLELVAGHAFEGQDWPRALHYQLLAGQRARKLFANHGAIDHFTKALQSAENLPEAETTLIGERQTIYAALGELLTTTGQYDRAQECLNQARELAASLGDVDAQARACRWRARLHELRGEYPPALEWIEHGLAVLAGRETAEAAELRLIAGLIHSRQGENERALSQCQAALQIAESLGGVTVLARANNLLGNLNRLHGKTSAALSYLQRAFDLYRQAGDINGQALTHNLTAIVYMHLSQWPQAERHYRQARDIFHKMGDLYNRAFADNNLGEILLKRGQLDEALGAYGEALRAFEQIGRSAYVLGALHNNLSAVYVRQGQAAPAREHLSMSQQYFEQAKARDFLPEMHRHFAEAALLAGDLRDAETHAQQALSLSLELSLRSEEGNSLRVLGEIALALGQLAQAEEHLRSSRAVLDAVGEVYESARTALVLAKLHLAQGERDKGLMAIGQCLPVFERLEAALDVTEARELHDRLARI